MYILGICILSFTNLSHFFWKKALFFHSFMQQISIELMVFIEQSCVFQALFRCWWYTVEQGESDQLSII